jgi:hypothetical protein
LLRYVDRMSENCEHSRQSVSGRSSRGRNSFGIPVLAADDILTKEPSEENVVRLLEHATASYLTLTEELQCLPPSAKSAIWRNMLTLSRDIARGVQCRIGDVLWGRPEPFPAQHNLAVLAEIGFLSGRLDRVANNASQTALLTLQVMTLVFHAETIATGESARNLAKALKYALADVVDEILEQ